MKKLFLVFSILFLNISTSFAQINVVTTLSSYADLVKTIGGDKVDVKYIAPPRFNPHFIEPKPSDVFKLKNADLFVHSGLDLEAWRDPLVQASGRADFKLGGDGQLDLSLGIPLLEVPVGQPSRSEGDIHLYGNPHYWLSPENGLIMAKSIAARLSKIDPEDSSLFNENFNTFEKELKNKITIWKSQFQSVKGTKLIGYHNEWVYLMNFLGLKMDEFLEPKPGIPPTPKHIEELIQYIKENNVPLIIQTAFYPKEAGEALEEKTGAKLTFLCQNVGESSEASSYISMINFNISQILKGISND